MTMDDSSLDELLSKSAPDRQSQNPRVQAELRRIVAESREHRGTPRSPKRRWWWLAVPVLALPAIGLVTTASTEPRLVPDFTIPITYTTDTGNIVDCSIDVYNGEIDYQEKSFTAVDWLKAQNWAGVGQKVYEKALSYENDAAWLNSEMNADGPLDARTVQYRAFLMGQDDVIFAPLDDGILRDGDHYGSFSSCTGELH
jgi:hypothetical protein